MIKRGDKVEVDVTYTQGTQGIMKVTLTTTTDKDGNEEENVKIWKPVQNKIYFITS